MKKTIEQGTLVKIENDYKQIVNYEMTFLDESYLDDVLVLQNKVADALENPDTFVSDT